MSTKAVPAATGLFSVLAITGSFWARRQFGRYAFNYDPSSSPGTAVATAPATNTQSTGAQVNQGVSPGNPVSPLPVAPVVQATITPEQMASITQAVTQGLSATILPQVTQLSTQIAATAARAEQLAQPQGNVQQLYNGGAPAIRTGENPLSSRGFQYQRMYGYHLGLDGYGPEQCKAELELSRDLTTYYSQSGMSHLLDARRNSQGILPTLVPLSADMIPDECRQSLAQKWGDIGFLISQGVSGFDTGRMRHHGRQAGFEGRVNQAMSMFDDTTMGVFTNAGPQGELITLIRNREAISRLGATQITLPPNGYLPFPKHTGAGTAYFVGEAGTITGSQVATGQMEMRAKKLAALMTVPNELLRFVSVDTEAFLRADMAAVMALKADLQTLEGIGSTNAWKGIITYNGINTHTSSMTLATDGNTFEPKTPTSMITVLEELNYDPETDGGAFLMRSKMYNNISERRASAHTAGVYDGPFLFPVNRDAVEKGMPTRLRGFPVVKSAQVSNTRTKGASTDLSYVIFGIWKHLLMGRIGVMEFAMNNQSDTNFTTYQTSLRCVQFADAAVRYENAFVLADQIDMDLPS